MEGESSPTQASKQAGAVFLSYASQDAEAAQRICTALRSAGVEVWFDQSELRGGDAWDRQIRKQIHDCALFVPVISAHSDARHEGYFRREWRLAVERSGDMAEDVAFVLPVVVDDTPDATARVPDRFREVQWSRLPGGQTSSAFVERVRRLLAPAPMRSSSSLASAAYAAPKRAAPDQPSGPAARKAIAVLPLANMSADPENEYFSDGITEDIINALAKVPGIQVASRTSSFAFKGKEVDLRHIGDKLGVASVLSGSVRKIGNRIRIVAQFVSVESGYHIWSETYNRQLEDVFAIQDEISRAIVDALKLQLVDQRAEPVVPTTNIEAYNLYLKGRFFFNKYTESGLRRGLDFFQQALTRDPGFARAFAGIADCWADLGDDWVAPDDAYPRAKAAATRALEYDSELADAMTSLGKVLCWYEWDFAAAARQLERAVRVNPSHAEAHYVLGSTLPAIGRLDAAIEEMRKAITLDPLSAMFSRWLGRFLLYSCDYAGAIAQNLKTLELDAGYFQAYLDIGAAHLALGDPEQAVTWWRKGQVLDSSVRSYDAFIVRALAPLGRHEEAAEILARLEEESRHQYVRAEAVAMGYAAIGDADRAFLSLERAFQARSAGLIYLQIEPGYMPLRSDPRFGELVHRIGLK
jgi:TolB-like protein/Tfp pilus assembly protein PilF